MPCRLSLRFQTRKVDAEPEANAKGPSSAKGTQLISCKQIAFVDDVIRSFSHEGLSKLWSMGGGSQGTIAQSARRDRSDGSLDVIAVSVGRASVSFSRRDRIRSSGPWCKRARGLGDAFRSTLFAAKRIIGPLPRRIGRPRTKACVATAWAAFPCQISTTFCARAKPVLASPLPAARQTIGATG